MTRADVEDALGQTADAGKEETHDATSNCDFDAGHAMVSITIQHLAARPVRALEMAALRQAIPEGTFRDAPGFGDGAFFLDIPGAGSQLHILRGDREHLMVSVLGFDVARASTAAERIARKALARMSTYRGMTW